MSDKRYPKDIQEIFNATRADMEVQLGEAEIFVEQTNSKCIDAIITAITETQKSLGGYVKEKSSILEKSAAEGKASVDALHAEIQNIGSLQAKLNSIDRSKDLIAHKQSITTAVEAELAKIMEKY